MVFQTRYPSWIILCYIWLLGFAHTGEAQAAKEGKARGESKVCSDLFISPSTCTSPRVRGAAGRASGAGRPSPDPRPLPAGGSE